MKNEKIEDILKKLSLEQKAALVCGKDFWCSNDIPRQGIRSLRFCDGTHGLRYQSGHGDHLGRNKAESATSFPLPSALCCSWDPALCFQIGSAMGLEAACKDVDVLLAPSVNLIINPLGGRNFESFSEDPILSGVMASAMIRGIQKHVSACLKHLVLNNREKFRQCINEVIDEDILWQLYLPAFAYTIQNARPDWIMSAYNRVNGEFCSENPELLNRFLKQYCHYEGAIVSDWGGCNSIGAALLAGQTLEMPATNGDSIQEILTAIKNGTLQESVLDERIAVLLTAIERSDLHKKKAPSTLDLQAHHQLCVQAAARCAVLLKNDHDLLPLGKDQKLMIAGPVFRPYTWQGEGSSKVEPAQRVSIKDAFAKCHLSLCEDSQPEFVHGYEMSGRKNNQYIQEALDAMNTCDAALVLLTMPALNSLEGLDRASMKIPANQLELIQALKGCQKPIIAVALCAGALETSWLEDVDAFFTMGLAGQGTPKALLRLVYGKDPFSGSLAETWAYEWKDYPTSQSWEPIQLNHLHSERMNVGYRYFETHDMPVRFPFGYSLCANDLEISDVRWSFEPEQGIVTFTLTNHAAHAIGKAIQLYREPIDSCLNDQCVTLIGFDHLMLEANESKRGEIRFGRNDFLAYDSQTRSVGCMKGNFRLRLGFDAHDVQAENSIYTPDLFGDTMDFSTLPARKGKLIQPDVWNTPLEMLEHTDSKTLKAMIRQMKKIRDLSIQKKKPNLFLLATLDMSLRSISKTSAGMLSNKKARQIAQKLKRYRFKF